MKFLSPLLLMLFFFTNGQAQINNYETEWTTIDRLEHFRRMDSAIVQTNALMAKSLLDSSNPAAKSHYIKALIYNNKFEIEKELKLNNNWTETYCYQEVLERLSPRLIGKAEETKDEVIKSMLYSNIADILLKYRSDYYTCRGLARRARIASQRAIREHNETTIIEEIEPETSAFQDSIQQLLLDIEQQTAKYLLLAIQSNKTQKIPAHNFKVLLEKTKYIDTVQFRYSLFDLLMDNAIWYFDTKASYITYKDTYKSFPFRDSLAFVPVAQFIQFDFAASDRYIRRFKAYELYQQLLQTHLYSGNRNILAKFDFERMQFANKHGSQVIRNLKGYYLTRLVQMEKTYSDVPFSTTIAYEIAQKLFDKDYQDMRYSNFDTRWNLRNAYDLCEAAVKRHPESVGAKNCQMIMNRIQQKELRLTLEGITPIDKPILAQISGRNLDKVYCKLLQLPANYYKKKKDLQLSKYDNKRDSIWDAYISKLNDKEAISWEVKIPNSGDFKEHTLEFSIPKQKAGAYLLLLSNKESFRYDENGLVYAYLQVSDLAFISRGRHLGQSFAEFFIVNRNNGAPIASATVTFLDENWKKINSAISKDNGHVSTKDIKKPDYSIRIAKGNDLLHLDNSIINYRSYDEDRNGKKTYLFTDKSIYRPGQTVHFKGIITNYKYNGLNDAIPNTKTKVTFNDANYDEISHLYVTSNEYGAYSGTFTIPISGLLGEMRLEDSLTENQISFRVEEYKKPTFEFSLNTKWYLGKEVDTLFTKGEAKTFSATPLADAQVKYAILRSDNDWSYNKDTLTVGTTSVDSKGKFYIKLDVPMEVDSLTYGYYYFIVADIVDLTGETHSSSSSIYLGNKNYYPWETKKERQEALEEVNVSIDWKIDDQLKRAKKCPILSFKAIATKGDETQTDAKIKGTIVIQQLKTPEQARINRFWNIPDTAVWSASEFKSKFPLYDYKEGESDLSNWKILDTIYYEAFADISEKEWTINTKKWKKGTYRIYCYAEDSYGDSHYKNQLFILDDALPVSDYNEAITVYNNYKDNDLIGVPNDTVWLKVGSYFEDANILLELENYRRVHEYRWLQPNRYQEVPIILTEKHRGNLHYRLSSVYNNRFKSQGDKIEVPWTNKELKIEYITFRDNLFPGQKEEWTIKISGPEGEAAAAEILASMYDAALDKLYNHSWQFDVFKQTHSHSLDEWSSNYNIMKRSFAVSQHPKWQLPSLYYQETYNPSIQSPISFLEFNQHWHITDPNSDDWDNDGVPNSKDREPFSQPGVEVDTYGVAIVERIKSTILTEILESESSSVGSRSYSSESYIDGARVPGNQPMPEPVLDSSPPTTTSPNDDFGDVKVRSNLKETAFFYPHLTTAEDGTVSIKFTMSEALSKWKFMVVAHTKDLQSSLSTKELITQKKLMVMPSTPRFLRQGDEVEIATKVSNLSEEDLKGKVTLQLFKAETEESIDVDFANEGAIKDLLLKKGEVIKTSWKIKIPEDWTTPIMYRIIAKADNFSDGEQNNLPVISNKILLTEAMSILTHGKTKKDYTFNSLKTNASSTLKHHKLTLELTPNPAWDAVLSLPYLMEYPYECSEQLFSRFYANSLATQVVNSNPKVKSVFDEWAATTTKESSLDKLLSNPSLKSAILEETPWVMNAQSDEEKRKHIGQLFDLNKMAKEFENVRKKLVDRQADDGGFSWFSGGPSSSFITQYIVGGMEKLQRLGANPLEKDAKSKKMLDKAKKYMDKEIVASYNSLRTRYTNDMDRKKDKGAIMLDDNLGYQAIQYLYAKSFSWKTEEVAKDSALTVAITYYLKQASFHWRNKSTYHQGMLALALHRINDENKLAPVIADSLKSHAIIDKDKGMYWKNSWGYYWYQLPIETQAMMIEVFAEVAKDEQAVYDLKLWLLQNKKGAAWSTTKGTTTACYALLMTGDDWLNDSKEISIQVAGKELDQSKLSKEAGTGYFKTSWDAKEITADMANITLDNPNSSPAFGALYWQYFEEYDNVKSFKDTPLKIKKELFVETRTMKGNKNTPIKEVQLKPGDLINVRIELDVGNDMEYVHLKDMRAAGFEPINVLSGYKYQGGLGYYEMTKDASTNFFFSYLRKGKYVFEYPLRVNHKGEFSNGVTTIQSMYAPEFTSHTKGIRVSVK
jgi:uncharacterized protein YfaS (alpha-2-macroglobulin family)